MVVIFFFPFFFFFFSFFSLGTSDMVKRKKVGSVVVWDELLGAIWPCGKTLVTVAFHGAIRFSIRMSSVPG